MTKTRFIKLMMAEGLQRNSAIIRAKCIVFFGSYQAMWDAWHPKSGNGYWLFGGNWNYGTHAGLGLFDISDILIGGCWWDRARGRPRKTYIDEVGPDDRISLTIDVPSPFNTYRLGARPASTP